MKGAALVRASWVGTALFAVTAGVATVAPRADLPALVVALGLFAAGFVAFGAALVLAARRSRTHVVGVGAVFFLGGCAPRRVGLWLMGSLTAQVVVAFVTAGIRPNTSLAFGVLVPTYGLGVAGVWGARHGEFPARARPAPPRSA